MRPILSPQDCANDDGSPTTDTSGLADQLLSSIPELASLHGLYDEFPAAAASDANAAVTAAAHASIFKTSHDPSDDAGDSDSDSDGADDTPATTNGTGAIHLHADAGSLLTAELRVGDGAELPPADQEPSEPDGAGMNVVVGATAPGLLHAKLNAGSANGHNDEGDTHDPGTDGAGDSETTGDGAPLVNVAASLAGIDAELSVSQSVDVDSETPPSDDGSSDPADDSGTGNGDTGTTDGESHGLLSSASAELIDAITDLAELECGCEDDQPGDGDQTGGDDTGGDSGSGSDTDSGSGADHDSTAGNGGDAGLSSVLTDGSVDAQINVAALDDVTVSVTSSADSSDNSTDTETPDGSDGDDGASSDDSDSGDASGNDPGVNDSGSGSDSGLSVGAELGIALAAAAANADVTLQATAYGGDDLSEVGAAMDDGSQGSDSDTGSDAETSPSGSDLGLGFPANDDCGCHNPLDSLSHGI